MEILHLLYLVLLFLSLFTVTKHFLHKLLNLPPTPFPSLPLIGHLYFFTKPTPFHRSLSHISRKHGPVVFVQLGTRPALLISSPSAAQECLTKNDLIFANRPFLLNGKYFGYNFTSLAWASYGDHWRNLRKISAVELLSSHKLHLLSDIRADEARALIHKVLLKGRDNNNRDDEVVEMRMLFFQYAYKVVTRMITGRKEVGSDEAEVFKEIVEDMSRLTLEANVVDFLPFMGWFGFGGIERKLRLVQEKRDRFMASVTETASQSVEGGGLKQDKSLIQVLRDLQMAEPEYYTDQTIRNLLLVLVHGATHTSATTLEWAFSHLLQNPDILRRAQSDIDNVVGKDGRLINSSDLSRIPYLRCVINETLRMHPAAPLLTPHLSSKKCTVGGYHIPRGTMLLVNAWDIQNNPQTWKDPEKYMPQRFEPEEGENNVMNYYHDFRLLPFGWGRRACPGENMAMDMVGLALGSLIQCFELEKVDEIDMSEGKGIITARVQPLRAKCTPRSFLLRLLS